MTLRRFRAAAVLLIAGILLPAGALAMTAAPPVALLDPPVSPPPPPIPAGASVPRADPEVAVLEPLPRLVGRPGRRAAALYQKLLEDDVAGVRAMYDAAIDALAKDTSREAADQLAAALLEFDPIALDPDDVAALDKATAQVVDSLGSTDELGDLNDLAVALALSAYAPDPEDSNGGYQAATAVHLLDDAAARFPDHPALAVNLAFLGSLGPADADGWAARIDALERSVDAEPSDVTARLLLASLQARRLDRDGLDDALATLDPLLATPETDTVGRLAVGDAYVAVVDRWGEVQPERARRLARLAVDSYDAVLAQGGLAAAFAGRAVALDHLGELVAARESARRTVDLNDNSAVRRVRLATLDACAGDRDASKRDATMGLELAGGQTPLFRELRFMADTSANRQGIGTDRGFGGISLGSARRPILPVDGGDTRGPTYLIDLFAVSGRLACLGPDSYPGGTARSMIIDASIAIGDSKTIVALDPEAEPDSDDVLAARLVAGDDLTGPVERVSGTVRAAPLIEPERALPLCRDAFPVADIPDFDSRSVVLACVIHAAGRIGALDDVQWGLDRLMPLVQVDADEEDAGALLEGADVLWRGGRVDEAERYFRIAAQIPSIAARAMARLGDQRLDAGDPQGAIALYDLAIAASEAAATIPYEDRTDIMAYRRLEQVARSNRGVATLTAVRPTEDAAPDCLAASAACLQASEDFTAAIASDPDNWVYHVDAGWVARLRGDASGAEAALGLALELDPVNARALNDLAVLEARRGAERQARERLLDAVAADGDFDLAAWNLAVLESRDPATIVSSQRWFALATDRNRALLTEPPELRFDEQVVRVTVGEQGQLTVDKVTSAPALTGLALGTVAAVGGLAQLLSGVRGDVQNVATSVEDERFGRPLRRWRLVERTRQAFDSKGFGWPAWLAWLPVLGILAVTTVIATAARAPEAGIGAVILALIATGAALLIHTAGHGIAAASTASVTPARFDRGYLLAVVGLAFSTVAGPYPADRVVDGDERRAWWGSLAGPLANLLAAIVACAMTLIEPLPFLRTLAAINLAVAAFALLPAGPLDGARLAARHPEVVAILGLAIALVSTALAVGIV